MNQFEEDNILIDFEEKINEPQVAQGYKQNFQEIELSDLIKQTKIIDKYLEQEKLNLDNQLQQLLKHLDGLEILANSKMESFLEPENAFQRNCSYLKNFTFLKMERLRSRLNTYRYSQKPKDLMQYYNEVEPRMKEFYKEYHHQYFEVLMFMERWKYYKKVEDDRDTKIILDIIN